MSTSHKHLFKIMQSMLAVLCVMLTIIVLVELNRDYAITPLANVDSTSQPLTMKEVAPTDTFVAIEAYENIINRPLFNDDRKPYVYVAPVAEQKPVKTKERPMPTKPQQQLSLTAVVITPEKSLAILQAGNNKTLQRVRLGETIDGWTLTEIQDQSVVLEQGGQTQTLELEVRGSNKTQKPALTQKSSETPPQDIVIVNEDKKPDITTENNAAIERDQDSKQ